MSLSLNINALLRCGFILCYLVLCGWLRHDIVITFGEPFSLRISPLYEALLSIAFLVAAALTKMVLFCYASAAFQIFDIVAGLINRIYYSLDSIYATDNFFYRGLPIPNWAVEALTWTLQVACIAVLVLSGTDSSIAILKKEDSGKPSSDV